MRLMTISLMLLLTACAADPAKVQQVADEEAERLPAPSKKLSSFAEYELKSMTFADAIKAEEGKREEGQEFEQNLQAKILPLLQEWRESGAGGQGTLFIEPVLRKIRIISGGNRFWAGAFAGDSFIDMDLGLVDGATGESIGVVKVYRNASAMTGGWSIGKSDQNLDDYIVSIVHEYLSDNY